MNGVDALLDQLKELGATLSPDGDRLIVRAGCQPVPAGLIRQIHRTKAEVLQAISPARVDARFWQHRLTEIPFAEAYIKKHGVTPAYVGYSAYHMVHVIAEAIERAGGSTDSDKLVTALEATDHVGTVGRIQFYGRDNQFTHAMKYGPGLVTTVAIQWQSGKQVCVWPADKCKAKITFPSFVKTPS